MFRLILCFAFLCVSCSKKEVLETKEKTVRLSIEADPTSLDPRKARDLSSGVIIRMLFEGLMRTGNDGSLENGVAKDVAVSDDGLTYTFSLRKMNWSNGLPLTANDFVFAWKSLLDPSFPSDTAYSLYPIKNAKRAKLGEVSLSDVGVQALDDETLVVHLEESVPYFLNLLTMPCFFPVCESAVSDSWAQDPKSLVSNGPFQMESWVHSDQIRAIKNPNYWEKENVKLSGIDLFILSQGTEFRFFEENKLDWIGSPLSAIPKDALDHLRKEEMLNIAPFLATGICRVNTQLDGPLSNPKFRKALALSIDRKAIVNHVLNGGQTVATGFVPPAIGGKEEGFFQDNSPELAKAMLAELALESPTVTLSYYNSERNRLIAQTLCEQWEKHLGIRVTLDAIEPKVFFSRISQKEFQLALGSWVADFGDPMNFLEVFKTKTTGTNNTGWENEQYIDLLTRSQICRDKQKRREILEEAERILMEDMPMIPIYFFAQNYVKNDALVGAFVSPEGHLNLRNASFKE